MIGEFNVNFIVRNSLCMHTVNIIVVTVNSPHCQYTQVTYQVRLHLLFGTFRADEAIGPGGPNSPIDENED